MKITIFFFLVIWFGGNPATFSEEEHVSTFRDEDLGKRREKISNNQAALYGYGTQHAVHTLTPLFRQLCQI
jgi:hypothetical protein